MKKQITLCATLLILLSAVGAYAAQIRVFVADMNAIGVQNKDEMKLTLQTLLASRLNSDGISAVGSAAEADVVVTGTYVTIGKVFSVDALAKTAAGKTLTRAFVQGEGQDELIPGLGKLADKLSAELGKIYSVGNVPTAAASPVLPSQVPHSAPKSDFIKTEQQISKAPASDFIKPVEYEQGSRGGWISKRLNGAANLMALGKTMADGSREVFLAEDRSVAVYLQAGNMKPLATLVLKANEKIISLDTLEDGVETDLYVTIIRGNELVSQVVRLKDGKLIKQADNLQYYFRTVSLAGGPKKLYAQAMGRDSDFYGDVYEAARNGDAITLKSPITMPRYGNIYSFNQFKDNENKIFTVVINPDNYLIIYDQTRTELWRSNDKFGGSELFFQKEDMSNARDTGVMVRWIFMNQRIQVTAKGEILVGKNDGFWVLGNARTYKKGAVYCMAWNGSSLEERWHTRDTQNYMPDFFYDEGSNELLILQTVQRSGPTTSGAASLAIKKVE